MRETDEERRETYNVACIFCNTPLTEYVEGVVGEFLKK